MDRYRVLVLEQVWADFIGLTPPLTEFLNANVPDGWRVVAVLPKDKGADVVIERL
jgi:hypothetical protein